MADFLRNTSETEMNNTATNNATTYTVKAGDTLFAIALKFNTTVDKLQLLNDIKDVNMISVGQVLRLVETPLPNTHTVEKGDTLFAIAQKYNTTVDILQSLNSIEDVNMIFVGQVLKLKHMI